MPNSLPHRPSFASLRKQAKTLLKRVRADDARAGALVREYHPQPDEFSTLRDAQLVVAREYGHAGWEDLCRSVEEAVSRASTLEARADLFTELACLSYFGTDHVQRRERASRLLSETPEIVAVDVAAAAAAFDVAALTEHITTDARKAISNGGPRGWFPLLYVCYSRVPEVGQRDSVGAAQILLEAGASGDTYLASEELGGWRWAGLTGAMGEGENGLLHQPPHARARELAELLLDAGADPNDAQGLYNTMFTSGNEWLELLLARGLDASAVVDPGRDELKTLDYQLSQAVKRGLADRVALLLSHGADANACDSYNGRPNYENAVLGGFPEIAVVLVDAGADATQLSVAGRFKAAVMRGEESEADAFLDDDPQLIADPALLLGASDKPQATRVLLALGADPNVSDHEGGRVALHEAAWSNNVSVIELLLAAGASCDIRESDHNATPIGFANHAGHFGTRDLLLDHSQDAFELALYGRVDQLQQLLADDPSLASARTSGGYTPMHSLPEDEESCHLIVALLLKYGADISAVAEDGTTPLAAALERENERVVTVLRSHGA